MKAIQPTDKTCPFGFRKPCDKECALYVNVDITYDPQDQIWHKEGCIFRFLDTQ
jgi:hypothetical protein